MTRVTTLDDTKAILDVFQKHGHNEVDTARIYGQGSSEEYLGDIEWQKRGIAMHTKLYPSKGIMSYSKVEYTHSAKDIRAGLLESFKALKTDKIDMWYLHGPDRKTPFEVTLREVDKLHKEGYFNRFGISNYMSWEVAQICEICEKNGWIKPTVYQGIYNALHRAIEPELLSCLRHYGIALYAFQPLAGGFLAGRYKRNQEEFEEGSRFDPNKMQGKLHHGRYWNEDYFQALDIIRPVIQKHGLTEPECALRWIMHHSKMSREMKDAVIVGASSPARLEENLIDLEKGPLPEEIVEALDSGWAIVRRVQFKYFH
jgi:aflatoxin B1 aldehyde reductase